MPTTHERIRANLFVSYASITRPRAVQLLGELRTQLAPSKRYAFSLWRDEDAILPGDAWRDAIDAALDECDAGLLLLSPQFLVSEFIQSVELPAIVGTKPIIPVMLEQIDAYHDMRGLDAVQIHAMRSDDGLRGYADCSTIKQRREFVRTLYRRIEQRMDRITGARS